jgi:hypothetical protein
VIARQLQVEDEPAEDPAPAAFRPRNRVAGRSLRPAPLGPGIFVLHARRERALYRMCDDRLRSLEEGTPVLFTSRIAAIVTIACTVVGGGALLGTFALTLAGGSEYVEFALAMIFFVSFLVGSYWWIVFGPGRGL